MDKAVLISIRSGWCCQIAAGKKTVELRKSRPNIDTPFRCYIYCTQATPLLAWQERWSPTHKAFRTELWPIHGYGLEKAQSLFELFNGRVIGTFVCDKINQLTHVGTMERSEPDKLYIETPDFQYESADELLQAACLSEGIAEEYLKGGDGYGWHIADLKIFDHPQAVYSFTGLRETRFGLMPVGLTHPPQSWCYVAEKKEDQDEVPGTH